MKIINKIIFLIFGFYMLSTPNLFALDTATHRNINEFIAQTTVNGFSLDSYLMDQLNISNGYKEELTNDETKTIFHWLGEGGVREDKPHWYLPYVRSVNHFHNPLHVVTGAGFSGIWGSTFLQGESSILWSQEQLGQQSSTGLLGNYSWYDVRDYFYKALTASDKTERETNFAETFRGLGQLMHLVEDLSVPEHTRDDGHALPAYEAWVKNNVKFFPDAGVIEVNKIPITPSYPYDISILSQQSPFWFWGAKIPVAWMFDANQYNGLNPNDTMQSGIGLSEYTNANFVSPDTIFSSLFPYPDKNTSVAVQDLNIPDPLNPGNTVARPYYMKIADGDFGYRLAGVDYFYVYRESQNIDENDAVALPPMDEYVYEDYAKKLIPRAVGYAAGLLDYFFRGRLQVLSLPVFYNNSIYAIMLNIQNITPSQEEISNGTFSLVVRYTPAGGSPDGSDDIFVQANEVESGVLPYDQAANFHFFLSGPVPIENLESVKCMLAFKGSLGNEDNAVIGKSFSPGALKFIEEWDNGLYTDEHPWFHTVQGSDQNYDNGETINIVENGVLKKSNIRYTNDRRGRINESFIYFADLGSPYQVIDATSPAGISITPNTYVIFKIDDLSINEQPPAPEGYTTAYQYFELQFNAIMNGQRMNNFPALEFTQPGQAIDEEGINECAYNFQLGAINIANIYDLFQRQGIAIPEPFYLQVIDLTQMLYDLAEPSTIQHRQDMAVDFISIVEGNDEDQAQQQ